MDWKIDFVQILATPLSLVVKVVKNQFNLMNRYFVWDVVRRYFKQIYETMDECLINLKVDNLFLDRKRIIHNSHPTQWAIEIDMLYTTNEVEKDVTPKKYSEVKADLPMLREVIDTLHYSKIIRGKMGQDKYSIDKVKMLDDQYGPYDVQDRLRTLFGEKL